MGQRGALDGWNSLPDLSRPSVVEVTVESVPRRRVVGGRGGRPLALLIVSVVLAGAVLGGVLVAAGRGGAPRQRPGETRTARATPPQTGPRLRGISQVAAVTEAYRFPLGCMGITLTHQALARALRIRSGPCWRYGVFVTAILRRTGGVWQLALEATSRSCPQVTLPPNIGAQLALCRR